MPGAFIDVVRRALASGRWVSLAAADNALTAVEFYHPGSTNSGLDALCTCALPDLRAWLMRALFLIFIGLQVLRRFQCVVCGCSG